MSGKSGGEVVWEWHLWDHLIQDHDAARSNFGDVAVVDIGGATTDVYCVPGADAEQATLGREAVGVPARRRTVEGDLGVPLSGRGKLPTSRPPWTIDLPEPPEVVGLRERLASVRFALKHAVEAGDTEHALKLGSEEKRLEGLVDRARRKWLASLG